MLKLCNSLRQALIWFMRLNLHLDWHWSGDNLADLPRAAWRDFRRAIRGPIIRSLACDDLIIVGDIYGPKNGPAVVVVPYGNTAEILGSICIHEGPAAVVPPGCKTLPVKEGG